jgi:hypothetical protein
MKTSDPDVNNPSVVAELRTLYLRYETALVTNDVETLTHLFWNSPLTTRLGVAENLHGFDEIAAFRRDRSPANLARNIIRLDILTFGDDMGHISLEFERTADGRLIKGRQSQLWVRFAQGWRITAAHVSLLP